MPGINQLKRKSFGDEKQKALAALFMLLVTLDNYVLVKQEAIKERAVKLLAYKGIFKKEFEVQSEFDLTQKLGDWLCSLPKGVWENKE